MASVSNDDGAAVAHPAPAGSSPTREAAAAAGHGDDERVVVFIANDGATSVRVKQEHCVQSLLMCDLLDGSDEDAPEIPLPSVLPETLHLLAAYFELRHNNPPAPIDRPLRQPLLSVVDETDKRFIEPLGEEAVLHLVRASNYLNYPALKALTCARCADWMAEKSVEEIRDMLGADNDFTPEEMAILRKEHNLTD